MSLTIQNVLDAVPEIANFPSQKSIKGITYELRMFTFYLPNKEPIKFSDFVKNNNLQNEIILNYAENKVLRLYSYHMINDDSYLLLSLSPFEE